MIYIDPHDASILAIIAESRHLKAPTKPTKLMPVGEEAKKIAIAIKDLRKAETQNIRETAKSIRKWSQTNRSKV